MSVSTHLNIPIEEYDARIRTFVPTYEDMIAAAAGAVGPLKNKSPRIVDLGIGTGELAARCLTVRREANIVGIDIDRAMLQVAQKRLPKHSVVGLINGDFRQIPFPPCNAIVASIALHHIKTPDEKRALYKRCFMALEASGLFVSADCFPARDKRLAEVHRQSWLAHLERTYSRAEAEAHLASWADEDTYFPLLDELQWMQEAGFMPEVLWRVNAFAVIASNRPDGA